MTDQEKRYACGIPMDEGMKMMYKHVFQIDPDECLPVKGDLGKLEIKVAQKRLSLSEFLKPRLNLVSVDSFSTKQINEDAIKNSGMPKEAAEACKRFYIDIYRAWGIIQDEGKPIGITYRLYAYNGIPRLIPDPEDFINQPDFNQQYGILFSKICQLDLELPPLTYHRSSLAFHRDFLQDNPILQMNAFRFYMSNLVDKFQRGRK